MPYKVSVIISPIMQQLARSLGGNIHIFHLYLNEYLWKYCCHGRLVLQRQRRVHARRSFMNYRANYLRYIEGIVRGYRNSLLTGQSYNNLTQCETIDGSPCLSCGNLYLAYRHQMSSFSSLQPMAIFSPLSHRTPQLRHLPTRPPTNLSQSFATYKHKPWDRWQSLWNI